MRNLNCCRRRNDFPGKSITEGRIELSVVTGEKGVPDASKNTEAGYRIRADREDAALYASFLKGAASCPGKYKGSKKCLRF